MNLKDGRILYIYSRFSGDSSSDHAPAHLAARYSSDGGKTWTREDETVVPNEGGRNVMSVSLLRLQNGDIALFYGRKNSLTDCTPQMRISKDEGKTWSEPISVITDKSGYFVLNNDRVIQLESGRILVPVALHNNNGNDFQEKGELFCYYSDDNGKTWGIEREGAGYNGFNYPGTGSYRIKGRACHDVYPGNRRISTNFHILQIKGETWSHIEASNIPSPLSPASIEKIPGNRRLAAGVEQ